MARLQLEGLYKPLLLEIFKRPVRSLLVARNITAVTPGPFVNGVFEFINSDYEFATWHRLVF